MVVWTPEERIPTRVYKVICSTECPFVFSIDKNRSESIRRYTRLSSDNHRHVRALWRASPPVAHSFIRVIRFSDGRFAFRRDQDAWFEELDAGHPPLLLSMRGDSPSIKTSLLDGAKDWTAPEHIHVSFTRKYRSTGRWITIDMFSFGRPSARMEFLDRSVPLPLFADAIDPIRFICCPASDTYLIAGPFVVSVC